MTNIVYGLVLAGGTSSRMGHDKGALVYHGVPQRVYCAELLAPFCKQVFVSCRKEHVARLEAGLLPLCDRYSDKGPLSGVLTAFDEHPEAAWLVLACDMPNVTRALLQLLVDARTLSTIPCADVVCFLNPATQAPEPLCALYESSFRFVIETAQEQGNTSLRHMITSTNTVFVQLPEMEKYSPLHSINTEAERNAWFARNL